MNQKRLTLLILAMLIIIPLGWFWYKNTAPHPELKTSSAKDSSVITTNNTSYFALQAYDGSLYKTKDTGIDGVKEFIESAPRFAGTEFIPEDFIHNSTLEKQAYDRDDPFLLSNGAQLTNEHYFFNQRLAGYPVFDAQLIVHLRNNNEIYSVHGNLVRNTAFDKPTITDPEAKDKALQKAKKDAKDIPLTIDIAQRYIVNKKILGESDDEKNYLTLAVTIKNTNTASDDFAKQYFIDLATGTIVHEEDFVFHALNRQIGCNASAGCSKGRAEGEAPVGGGIDTLYDMIGAYHAFLLQNFQRDSLNGSGGKITAQFKPPCKNAAWNGSFISVCSDMVTADVIFHELTHGLTTYTANFAQTTQGGMLNEGNSDVFSISAQQGDYIMSGPNGSVVRNLQDPASNDQPDMLFSPNYECPEEVHHESTVLGHAFYLMSEGGTKNNCAISPIGKLNAIKIQYQALTKYLNATANYKSYYTAMINACNDLFQQASSTCRQVKAALVATQMDQQPDNTQKGAKCSGAKAKPVACPAAVASTPLPATSGSPTSSASAATPSAPTPFPTQTVMPTQTYVTPTYFILQNGNYKK
jgi:Zn-dependent metalloprotease